MDVQKAYLIIGTNIRKYRKQKAVFQLALALEMGYSSISIVSMSETGASSKHFNIEHLLKISKILQVDICCFFEDLQSYTK